MTLDPGFVIRFLGIDLTLPSSCRCRFGSNYGFFSYIYGKAELVLDNK